MPSATAVGQCRDEPLLSPLDEQQPGLEPGTRRTLAFIKVLYFMGGFSGASFGRFATLFYLSPPRSLNAGHIGLIEAAQPPFNALGNTLFGWLADRLQRKKAVTLGTQLVTTIAIVSFLVPSIGCCFEPIILVMATNAFFSGKRGKRER